MIKAPTGITFNATAISHYTAAVAGIGLGVAGLVSGHVGPMALDYSLLSGGFALLVGKGVFNIPAVP
jgi:hypothetical protein